MKDCTCKTAPVVDGYGRLLGVQVVQLDLRCPYCFPGMIDHSQKEPNHEHTD